MNLHVFSCVVSARARVCVGRCVGVCMCVGKCVGVCVCV